MKEITLTARIGKCVPFRHSTKAHLLFRNARTFSYIGGFRKVLCVT